MTQEDTHVAVRTKDEENSVNEWYRSYNSIFNEKLNTLLSVLSKRLESLKLSSLENENRVEGTFILSFKYFCTVLIFQSIYYL